MISTYKNLHFIFICGDTISNIDTTYKILLYLLLININYKGYKLLLGALV